MKRVIYTLLLLSTTLIAFGQNEFDALRYSQTFHNGSARFVSMGGAFGALGGDFTAISYNPASIGVYRSSEFVFSPSFDVNKVESNFIGTSMEDSKYKFNLNNIGFVSTYKANESSPWVNFNFGLGYNKHTSFNNNILIAGEGYNSSMLDNLTENANSGIWSDYYEELAWNADIMPYDTINNEYWNDINEAGYDQYMKRYLNTKGNIGELVLSFGANYNHQLYLGATIGIYSLSYEQNMDHNEVDDLAVIDYFDSFQLKEHFKVRGSGYTFKLGAIYKPINMLRVGAAIHFPTIYDMEEEFYTSIYSTFDTEPDIEVLSPLGAYKYSLTTPFKYMGSVAFQFQKKGMISLDYEMIDYSTSRLHADDYDFYIENQSIKNTFKQTHNIRVGGELRVNSTFSLRGGYAYYGSPYKEDIGVDESFSIMSAGFGVKDESFFLDFAYSYTMYKEKYFMYNHANLDAADLDFNKSKFIATIGFRF